MTSPAVHTFGIVDDNEDFFELHWEVGRKACCRLDSVVHAQQTVERKELASIPAALWRPISKRVFRELADGMGASERKKRVPTLKRGDNRMGPFVGRELTVLFWALMEAGQHGNMEAILLSWRELAREERWWLYSRAAAPGQRAGAGWRLALFHALSEVTDTRVAQPDTVDNATEKKSPGNGSRPRRRSKTGKKQVKKSRSKAARCS